MYGLGTVINAAAIAVGGLLGLLCGKFIKERLKDTLGKACGVCVIFLGIAGALEEMFSIQADGTLSAGGSLLLVGCLTLGGLVGELLNIEAGFEKFGEWLKKRTGNAKDGSFVNGFVTASLTVCIGAMAIVGAVEDGINGDISILVTKAILDLVIIMVMACSLGKGCLFSAIPVALWQGSITLISRLIAPFLTESALSNLSLIGSVLIFCVGVNLLFGKKIRVANLLPGVFLAVGVAFLPF
jgi:uncharacterized membrane protein YqgA involved in biofilm formation